MTIVPIGNQELDSYLNILKFLNESTDDYFFLLEFRSKHLYLFGNIQKRYPLQINQEQYCSIEDWFGIVYEKDLPGLKEDLSQILCGKSYEHNMEYRIIDRNGNRVWISCRGKCQIQTDENNLILVGRVSDTVLVQKTDPLTGAFNMNMLVDDMNKILKSEKRCHLLLIGIDNFKHINIKYGREYGNHILKYVAEALEDISNTAKIYRLDGDCFAVNLFDFSREKVETLYEKLCRRVEKHCTISGGAVPYLEAMTEDGNVLYQFAEEALDRSKKKGKNMLSFFSIQDYERKLSDIELKEEMQHSIQNGFQGFFLCYQPQVCFDSCRLFGAEALLRYRSSLRGLVGPDEFIPILEQTGMIYPVGMWVLETALNQCRLWRSHLPDFHISVNISYVQLEKSDITQNVLEILERSKVPGSALTLEVTENMQLRDYPHFNKIFYQWKKYGIEISVDDFGTGYSSLSHLKSMEINEIKIDRCFVSGIQHSAYNYRLLSNMLELAKSSQIRVCCEGIENVDELCALEELQPDLLQGYLFSKPCTPKEFEKQFIYNDCFSYTIGNVRKKNCCQFLSHHKEIPPITWENLDVIMEALDEIIYVSDLHTYELYYLNPAGKRITGIYDYKGRKCYHVLQGRSDPCEFCNNDCLKKDVFFSWERENPFLNRHFLLKDKLVNWKGKTARLEYAIDVTHQELVSQNIREQLELSENIIGCAQALTEEKDMETATQRILSNIGQFYEADQAYLFEPDEYKKGYWCNTYEWCREGISPQKYELQQVSSPHIRQWMEAFYQNKSIILSNNDSISFVKKEGMSYLNYNNIKRLIVCPILLNGKLVGFIGVNNPRHCIMDDTLIRTMTSFIAGRFRFNETEERLGELLNLHYRDILRATEVGLWVIRMNKEKKHFEMFADENMKKILGIFHKVTPEECYQHWYSRINDGYYDYVKMAMNDMAKSENVVQLQYTWNHPVMGEVVVRCTGIRAEDETSGICLEGYHRIVSNVNQKSFLHGTPSSEMFEYNEKKSAIYFHTERNLITGSSLREENFPDCWIHQEIVHPHFINEFLNIFKNVYLNDDQEEQEMLLKTKTEEYSWFRIKTRHLGKEDQDRNTILVLIDPANRERTMELEHLKLKDFYKASLAETIAYAEVDLESGLLQEMGGIWKEYEQEYKESGDSFLEFLAKQLKSTCLIENPDGLWIFLDHVDWNRILTQEDHTQRFTYRRKFKNEWRWVELVMHVFQEQFSKNMYALIYLKDIEMQKQQEIAQKNAAVRDPLTKVYNRTAFEEKVLYYLSESSNCGVLILLDVDNFKNINDHYGHLVGDSALKFVTNQLRSVFRNEDIIGRMGGDEFLVFLKGSIGKETLEKRMDKLFSDLHNKIDIPISCSAGLVSVSGKNFSYEEAIRQADIALYRSKQIGKSTYCFANDMN